MPVPSPPTLSSAARSLFQDQKGTAQEFLDGRIALVVEVAQEVWG
jgi:hypothetical protein